MDWLIWSDGGLLLRGVTGGGILAVLALIDWRRRGSAATRWREYVVLLITVAAAIAYGVLNDQITVAISWEYFFYGKELEHILGSTLPPNPWALHWEAAKVGMKATWSAGLLIGVALLIANNPRPGMPRLRYRTLLRIGLPTVLLTAAGCAVVGGLLGYAGLFNSLTADFRDMVHADIFRPRHFLGTWGVHLGGYVGGLLGTLLAVVRIWRRRRAAQPSAAWV